MINTVRVVLEQILVDFDDRVDYLPCVLSYVISFNIGRDIPFTKAATHSSEFINESIFPVQQAVRGRNKME
jgi:hypothetical protein